MGSHEAYTSFIQYVQTFDEDENIGDPTLEYLIITSSKSDVLNGMIKGHFGKQISTETKLGIHNIISKATLRYGSELWIMNRKDQKQLGAAQMRFLRPLLDLTRRDRQRNIDVRNKLNQDDIVDEIRNYQQNWL
jgi:hypothetical protein